MKLYDCFETSDITKNLRMPHMQVLLQTVLLWRYSPSFLLSQFLAVSEQRTMTFYSGLFVHRVCECVNIPFLFFMICEAWWNVTLKEFKHIIVGGFKNLSLLRLKQKLLKRWICPQCTIFLMWLTVFYENTWLGVSSCRCSHLSWKLGTGIKKGVQIVQCGIKLFKLIRDKFKQKGGGNILEGHIAFLRLTQTSHIIFLIHIHELAEKIWKNTRFGTREAWFEREYEFYFSVKRFWTK